MDVQLGVSRAICCRLKKDDQSWSRTSDVCWCADAAHIVSSACRRHSTESARMKMRPKVGALKTGKTPMMPYRHICSPCSLPYTSASAHVGGNLQPNYSPRAAERRRPGGRLSSCPWQRPHPGKDPQMARLPVCVCAAECLSALAFSQGFTNSAHRRSTYRSLKYNGEGKKSVREPIKTACKKAAFWYLQICLFLKKENIQKNHLILTINTESNWIQLFFFLLICL